MDDRDLKKWVEGPEGTFIIELEDDDRWSVKKIFGDGSLQGSQYMLDGAGRTFGWDNCSDAVYAAKQHAGLIPVPDRRGLVAHSRNLA